MGAHTHTHTGKFPTQVGGWWSTGALNMASFFIKKKNHNLSESNSETEENQYAKYVMVESLDDLSLSTLSPFLIERVITSRSKPKSVKNSESNLLVEVNKQKQAENLLKWKYFTITNVNLIHMND